MNFKDLHQKLFDMREEEYQINQSHTMPNIEREKIIGIRVPQLKKFKKKFFDEKSKAAFINKLPHKYFEEDLIHVFILNEMQDYNKCISAVKNFVPYIDNWAICDSLMPKIFTQHTDELLQEIKIWLASDSTYTVRFAISMLRKFYLDEKFDKKYLKMVADIQSDKYYIETMAAWFFNDALFKQYDDAIIYLQEKILYPKIQTKTIQKAIDSPRFSDSEKEYLKTLRRGRY